MAPMPVICDRCHRVWVTEGLFGGEGTVQLQGVTVGGCPYCGGVGHVPDGLYSISGPVTRVLSQLSTQDLAKLTQVIRGFTKSTDEETIRRRIVEEVPAAKPIVETIQSRGQLLAQWLPIILALLALLQGEFKSTDVNVKVTGMTQKQLKQIIERAERPAESGGHLAKRPRLSPGDPCWCGSGSSYKHCHGRR